MCGRISVTRFPDTVKQISKYKVTMISEDKDKASLVTTETDPHGAFCFKAKSGTYNVQVRMSFIVGLSWCSRRFSSFGKHVGKAGFALPGFTVNFHYF